MLAAMLLALREGLEAALIIGILIGALVKLQRQELKPAVWLGILAAGLVSLLVGIMLTAIGRGLEEPGEQIFEGMAMLLAAGVLTWMIFWMQGHAQGMKASLEQNVSAASLNKPYLSLFLLAFLTVIREGVELSLFLTAAMFATDAQQILLGAGLGLALAGLLGWLIYASTIQFNLRRFFRITSFLLLIFAAGLIAHGVHEFNELGWIPPIIDPIWNINHLLDEHSGVGQVLKALFGYNGNPSLTEALAYAGYLVLIALALRTMRTSQAHPRAVMTQK